jgi:hypothetical protein
VNLGSWRSAPNVMCESLTHTSRESDFSLLRNTHNRRPRAELDEHPNKLDQRTDLRLALLLHHARDICPSSYPHHNVNSAFRHARLPQLFVQSHQPRIHATKTKDRDYTPHIIHRHSFNHPTAQCPPPRHSTALRSSTATSCPSTTKTIGRFRSSSAL